MLTPQARKKYGLDFHISQTAHSLADMVHFMTKDAGPNDRLVIEPWSVQELKKKAAAVVEGASGN